jgi:beta-lactamase regulating signal transducer with metallopeptidase domain
METLFIYVLKTNGLLLLFWIFYRIFLKKETFYNTTRSYFLFSIAFALIAPALFFTKTVWVEPQVANKLSQSENIVYTQEVFYEDIPNLEEQHINYTELDYYIVFTISALLVLIASLKIFKLIIKINKLDKFKGNIKLDKQSKNVFSFGKWVVVSPEIAQSKDIDLILKHEQLHVNLFNTFDLLLLEILTNLFWFNPLLKRLQSDVILNHEYQVDALLINESNKIRYQMCLLQTQLNHQSSLLCTFNQSDLKKRIVQINNQKSKTMKKLKFLFSIPVLVLFFALFQVKTIAQVIPSIPNKKTSSIVSDTLKPIYVLDGKQINESQFKKIDSKDIKTINIIKDNDAITKYGDKAKYGAIEISLKQDTSLVLTKQEKDSVLKIKPKNVTINKAEQITSDSLIYNDKKIFIVDNIETTKEELDKINSNTIETITVLKSEKAIAKYGDKGKNGVLEITTKQNIEEKNTDNKKLNKNIESKKQTELDRKKALNDKKQAKLDKQQALKDKKQAEELARQEISNKTNSKYNVSYIASAKNTNETPYAYFSEPNKNIKAVHLLDGKLIEKKNIDYKKVDFVKIVQDEEAKKLANDQTVDIAVILTMREKSNK